MIEFSYPVGVENSIASVAARQRHLVASTGFEPGSVMVSAIRAHSWVRATSRSASTFGQGPGRRRTNGERPRLHDHPSDATHQRAGRRIRIGHRLSEEAPRGTISLRSSPPRYTNPPPSTRVFEAIDGDDPQRRRSALCAAYRSISSYSFSGPRRHAVLCRHTR